MGKITLYNRERKILENELVYGEPFLRLIYGTGPGLFLAELLLKKKFFSLFYGNLLKKPSSRKKINPYIRDHHINLEEIEDPLDSFASFNDFFIRKLKPEARPVENDPDTLISPADSRLSVFKIKHDTVFPVKGKNFSLFQLTNDTSLSEKYLNGICLVFRLAPADYHRFCYLDNGVQGPVKQLGSFYHSVSPIALESNLGVFEGNYREFCELKTENFGDVLDIDIGAMGVSKIVQNNPGGGAFKKGQEKGYFEFGGSTIVIVMQPGTVRIDDDIFEYSRLGIETLVRYGASIGRAL
jgi:phosphatidylserine decarboxylase